MISSEGEQWGRDQICPELSNILGGVHPINQKMKYRPKDAVISQVGLQYAAGGFNQEKIKFSQAEMEK